jgi:hypothetical protein
MTAAPTPTPLVVVPPVEEVEAGFDVEMGFGACSDCPCTGFTGSGSVCENCGHNYDRHA